MRLSTPVPFLAQKLTLTTGAGNVVRFAMEEASDLDHKYVGTPHLLLGLLREFEG